MKFRIASLLLFTSVIGFAQWIPSSRLPICPGSNVTTANYVLTYNATLKCYGPAAAPGASGGEANTLSSVGGGTSLYSGKVGVDLQIKSLGAGSSKFAITPSGNLVNLDIVEANINLANLGGSLALTQLAAGTRGDIITAQGASPVWTRLAKGTQYQVFTGGATEPGWGAVNLAQSSAVTGILGAANGGSGNAFFSITGPTTSVKTFTFPNADATIEYQANKNASSGYAGLDSGSRIAKAQAPSTTVYTDANTTFGNFAFDFGSASRFRPAVASSNPATCTAGDWVYNSTNHMSMLCTATNEWSIGAGGFGLSSAMPATCKAGDIYFQTDATAGSNLYGCTAANTWTLMGGGSGNVIGGVSSTAGNIPKFSDTTGRAIQDGYGLVTSVGSPGSNTNVPSEAAVRSAISAAGGGNVNAGGTLTANLPVIGAGTTAVSVGTVSGNTTQFVTTTGTQTSGANVVIDASGNHVAATSPLTGTYGGTNNAFMQFTGPASTTKTYTLPNSSSTIAVLGTSQSWTAAQTFTSGNLLFGGATSGTTTVNASATASGTLTLPAATDTLVGKATTDTFTNKTYDTAGTGNVFRINGTQISAVTGTGSAVLATSPTLVTPVLGVATATSINGTSIPSSKTLMATDTALNASQLPALTGDVTSSSGSAATTVANIPTGVTMAGSLLSTAIAAPATPAVGKASIYVDSTSKNIAVKNDAGTVNHGVQTQAAVTSNFVTAISDAGAVTVAQPGVSDLSSSTSANLRTVISDETGTGVLVFATSPTLVTPTLGVATATSINGTTIPTSATLLTSASTLANLGASTSANLSGILSDETGSGVAVFATSPTLVTPTLGVATATSINKVAITAPATSATLTIANGKTLTVSNTMTLAGGDSTNITFPNATATALTTNAAVTLAQGGIGITSGTSGGVPYFSSTSAVASSGALTANAIVLGGGAGAAPTSSVVSIDSGGNITGVQSIAVGDGTVAGEVTMSELAVNGSSYISWLAPDSITNTLRLRFPNASPTAAQSMRFSAPVSNVSDISFVDLLADPGANGVVSRSALGTTAQASVTEMSAPVFAADAGANDTYTATLSPAPGSYVTGTHYRFKANTANTGAASINFNSLGAKAIKKAAGGITTDLADNDIRAGQWVDVVYDGTNMQMQSLLGNAPAGSGTVTSIATTAPITGGTITSTGTIGCATCVTSAASLTNGQLVFGAGSQGSAVGNLSGDVTTSGSGATTLANVPSGVAMAGSLLATAIVAPATPAAGKGSIYVDSTSKNISVKDDAGVVKHGVQTKAAVTSNFLTAISDAGVVSAAQPGVADLSSSTSSSLATVISDETGSGALVFATSPTLVTPTLGVATATSINGTSIPSTATLLTTSSTLANLASSTSANLSALLSDETGSGVAVFATSPTLVTPALGTPTALVLTNATGLPTAGLVNNAVTSAKMAIVNTRQVCDMVFGDTSGSALTNAQLGPQKRLCYIPAAATLQEVIVSADGGTPNIIVARNVAGTVNNVLSAALATAASGGIACSKTSAVAGIDGTTCSATLQNTALAAGSYLEAVSGTAGGTAKLMTVHAVYTID